MPSLCARFSTVPLHYPAAVIVWRSDAAFPFLDAQSGDAVRILRSDATVDEREKETACRLVFITQARHEQNIICGVETTNLFSRIRAMSLASIDRLVAKRYSDATLK